MKRTTGILGWLQRKAEEHKGGFLMLLDRLRVHRVLKRLHGYTEVTQCAVGHKRVL